MSLKSWLYEDYELKLCYVLPPREFQYLQRTNQGFDPISNDEN